MDCAWVEDLPSDRRKAAEEELIRGQDLAVKLRALLQESLDGEVSSSTEDLVRGILSSFATTLTMLNQSEEVSQSQVQVNSSVNSPSSLESGESCKSSTGRDRRGCYKRRKTAYSYTRDTSAQYDDGHAWRKYGQKVILNAQYPRNYFRCTHKHDQGCQATKQVQRIQEDPPKYRTTYYGHHTCKNFLKAPEMILDSNPDDSSVFLRFDSPLSTITPKREQSNPVSGSSFASVKEEVKEEKLQKQSLSSDYFVPADLRAFFESSGNLPGVSSSLESDPEVMMGVVDYDDMLPFGEDF